MDQGFSSIGIRRLLGKRNISGRMVRKCSSLALSIRSRESTVTHTSQDISGKRSMYDIVTDLN